MCVYIIYALGHTCVITNSWRSEDNFTESVLSWDRTQVIGLEQQVPLPTEPSRWP